MDTNKTFTNVMPWTNVQVRNGAFPLEKYSIFETYADAKEYALSSPVSYEGQLVAVTENGIQNVYVLDHAATDGLRKLASGGDADEVAQHLAQLSSELLAENGIVDQLSGAIDDVNEAAALSVETLSTAAYTDLSIALTSEEGEGDILKTYTLTQGGAEIGKIDIPKDLVIEAAGLVTYDGEAAKITVGGKEYNVKGTHDAGEYIVMVTAVSEDQIWIPVKDLIDTYVGGETTTIDVDVELSGDQKIITASVKAGSITRDLLSSDLTAELDGLRTDINTVSADLGTEVARAKGVEDVLSGLIKDEETARKADVSFLSGAIDDAVAAHEEDISLLRDDLSEEINRAISAETALSDLVAAEETRAKGEESTLSGMVAAEETRATTKETALETAISNEETRAKGVEDTISSNVIAETARAEAAEQALSDLIESLSSDAGDIDAQLCTMIQDETARALTAEGNLSTLITTETTTRIAQDEALQANIDALSVSLEGKINVEKTAREAKDAELTAAIEANRTAIETEATRAKGVEDTISSNVIAEETRAKGVEDTISSNVIAEETRAKGVEDTISSNVIAEETRAKGVEEDLQSQIDELSAGAYDNFETKEDAQSKYNDLSGKIKTESDARVADDKVLSDAINDINENLKDYALSADVTAIKNDLDDRKLDKTTFAQISNDIGLSAASLTNKVVTQNDIKGLSGAMVLVGKVDKEGAPVLTTGSAAKLSDLFDEIPLGRTSADPAVGDVVIQTQATQKAGETVDKEFVWTAQNGGQWNELGSEGVYATKVELENETEAREQGDIDTLSAAKEYADSISTALSTDYTTKITAEETARKADDSFLSGKIDEINDSLEDYALSADVTAIRNELTAADDFLSGKIDDEVARAEGVENALSDAISAEVERAEGVENALSDAISAEVERAEGVEDELSTAIKQKIWIKDANSTKYASGDYGELSVVKVTEDEYMAKVADGTLMADGVLYVISSDHINAYGQKIVNVAAPEDAADAANKEYVDTEVQKVAASALSAIELNGLEFNISNNKATLNIDIINCGGAAD